ncbi:MAG: 4-hydroxy-tetrahydrodipicolinate reductase [Rhodospirillaceae bacterium]|nr:4-hydroxy-tetrahydrodipicolinate reductase [Rhodospirillaceae bacterium]
MKIGITGAAGRMGRMLINAVLATDGCQLAGATEAPGTNAIGMDVGLLTSGLKDIGVHVIDNSKNLFAISDVVIDFTSPKVTEMHASLAGEHKTALIIGTTGLEVQHQDALERAGEKTAIVQAANFSVGVNLLLGLAEQAAKVLPESYDIEISDMHHRHKVDAPSGTALALGHAAAKGRGVNLTDVMVTARDGIVGPRRSGDIGMAVFRGGDVVGDHTVMFAANGERVELTHKAGSREIFAAGALRAAMWSNNKKPGIYSMRDVLGF